MDLASSSETQVSKKLIALDVGEVRVGVAAGELGSSFAFGRGFFKRQTQVKDIETVQRLLEQEGANLIVIGLPKRRDGSYSKQTQRVRSFAKALEDAGLKIAFEDERFTTQLAAKGIAKSSLARKKRQEKGRLDEAAAVLILETYLAKCAGGIN